MKNRIQIALVALIALAGVAIGHALPRPVAEAQPPQQFRECFSASLWHHDGAALASPGFRPRTVAVPRGFVPVGGAGNEAQFAVVLCR